MEITTTAELLRPKRKITGISAILLPFTEAGEVDWEGLDNHITRTAEAGLAPAVNMDTGYANFIDEKTRTEVLKRTQAIMGNQFYVAGAFVADQPGTQFNLAAYSRQIERIQSHGGTPIIFQSYGLVKQPSTEIVSSYRRIANYCDTFIAFELGEMFAPFGKIYDLDTYAGLMDIPQCTGAKHSSLNRSLEWQRLALRNEQRPDFKVYTGNDLAIDMVMYGSDYLLGLSTFAPDLFAQRDAYWEQGDAAFYELNDRLQYLGFFVFRPPVPKYRHSAAQFLKLRGWITSDTPHPKGGRRPESDIPVLQDIANRLGA